MRMIDTLRGIRAAGAICSLVAFVAFSAPTAQAQETAKGGAQKLTEARPLKSGMDVQKLKEGDTVVSACAKCQMISYTRIGETGKGGTQREVKDACPSCGSKLSGEQAMHKCKMCGSEMMCSVIPGKSARATLEK